MENTNDIYACAYKEVITILSALPDYEWNKIPQEKRDFYFECMDKDYNFEIDFNKPISEQKLLKQTRGILSNLFKNYLSSPNEKEEIINRERKEAEERELEKRKKYNPDDIFAKKTIENKNENEIIDYPVKIENKTFFQKIIEKIKKIFKVK